MLNKPYTFVVLLFINTYFDIKPARRLSRRYTRRWSEGRIDIRRAQDKTLIVCNGTMVNERDLDPLAYAVFINDYKSVATLLERGCIPRKKIAGLSLEQYAKINQYTKTLHLLKQSKKSQN